MRRKLSGWGRGPDDVCVWHDPEVARRDDTSGGGAKAIWVEALLAGRGWAAAGDDGVPGLVHRGVGRGAVAASISAQRSAGEPLLVIRPRTTAPSALSYLLRKRSVVQVHT